MPPTEKKNEKQPPSSKLLELTGAVGKPKVTIDEASIKTLKKIEDYTDEYEQLKERIKRLES
jgi:hypothetical protein